MAKSRKGSRKSRRGGKKGSRRGSKKSRRGSKKSRKGSKKSRKGSKKSRKGSKKSKRGSKKSSSKIVGNNTFYFMAWYKNKPKVNNRIQTEDADVKLDDDDEWNFTGYAKANTKEQVQSWLRSLGTIKKYSDTNTQRMEVSSA